VARDRVVEGLRDGIIVVDPEERIIDLNPAAVRLTTVARSDVGRDLDAAFPASEDVIAQLRDSLEVDGATLEVSPRGHPERVVEISASPIHEPSGRRIAVVATVRDVTERVRMAQELKTRTDELALALERSSTVLAAMSEGVVLVDGDGTLVSCNPAVWRILRTERVLSPGSPAADLGDVLPVEALMARAREAGEPITRLVEVGGGRSIGVEVIPLQPRDARPPQTLFVIRDETERDAARRMQRNFMANVSHELLTPLTGLSLLADTVPRALRDDPGRVDGFARRLSTEVRRVTRIAETLLTLSRVEEVGSAADPPQTRIDISRLISEIVDGITPLLHEKGHHLVVDAPRGLWVKGDGPSLSALVGGLLENAVHYTPPEGHISVRTGLDDEGGCPWVVLRVTDDGVGISADDQQRIFERFYRVDKARSRTTGGTGLGLSIVQQTAEQHGGSVSVESRLGSGSTFTVRLPADV
jgi:two-component system sensor histidine kinase SenX3